MISSNGFMFNLNLCDSYSIFFCIRAKAYIKFLGHFFSQGYLILLFSIALTMEFG